MNEAAARLLARDDELCSPESILVITTQKTTPGIVVAGILKKHFSTTPSVNRPSSVEPFISIHRCFNVSLQPPVWESACRRLISDKP